MKNEEQANAELARLSLAGGFSPGSHVEADNQLVQSDRFLLNTIGEGARTHGKLPGIPSSILLRSVQMTLSLEKDYANMKIVLNVVIQFGNRFANHNNVNRLADVELMGVTTWVEDAKVRCVPAQNMGGRVPQAVSGGDDLWNYYEHITTGMRMKLFAQQIW